MSLRKKSYTRVLILLLLFSLMMACIPRDLMKTFVSVFASSEETRCKKDGGDWYYNEELKKWMCRYGAAPFMLPDLPEESSSDEKAPSEVDTSVPDGTYVGTTTLPEFWAGLAGGHWDGTIVRNEITIIVAEDGSVSGALMVGSVGEKSAPIDGCVSQINLYVEGTLSGKLTETGGTIDIQLTRTDEVWRSGCPSGTETETENGEVQAQVSIIENKIIKGAVPAYFSFEASKR